MNNKKYIWTSTWHDYTGISISYATNDMTLSGQFWEYCLLFGVHIKTMNYCNDSHSYIDDIY